MERYLITGASRGIGRAIANRIASPERELILHGRDQEALVEVFTEIEAAGAKPTILTCDLSRPEEIDAMVEKIYGKPLHGLINNAGIAIVNPLKDTSLEDWQQTFDVNVTAPFLLTQKLAPSMPRGATIVNILSVAAKTGFPGWSAYCMSKFALEGFSQSIREELQPQGVRVVNIYPSATATEIWDDVEGDWPREKMLPAGEVAEAVAFALSRPPSVLVENISVGNHTGSL